MGKVDDMRAMREARFARTQPAAAKLAKARKVVESVVTPAPVGELCGHRSIGNKSCTREAGHQASGTKNHRYS